MKQLKEESDLAVSENSELIESQTEDLVEEPKGKVLHIKNGQKGVDFRGVLVQLSQYADIEHTLTHIDRVKQYVVQVPLQYQKALDEGTYFINQNQTTGVMWPSLMEVRESGCEDTV